ncbi:hypothetical protein CPB83DRAFT_864448 [Crepidotus variabilis]|uniref:Uncharacterized protein n=1 Tax=Crepidotus variabilis TaxID=179855 RepID=A0A9P6E4N4_9AGAR|nr:hypothetical protein CPB83DRAFT_864448 [Crepidotus variabilis]
MNMATYIRLSVRVPQRALVSCPYLCPKNASQPPNRSPSRTLARHRGFPDLADSDYVTFSQLSKSCRWLRKIFNPLIQAHMADLLKKSTIPTILLPLLALDRINQDSSDKIYLGRSYQLLRLEIAYDDTFSTILPIRYLVSCARSIEAIEIELLGRVADAVAPLSTLLNLCALRTWNLTVRENTEFSWPCWGKRRLPPWTQDGSPFRFVYQRPVAATTLSALNNDNLSEYRSMGHLLSGSFVNMREVRESRPTCPPIWDWVIKPQKPRYAVTLPPKPHVLHLKKFELDADELFTASMYPWVHHVLNTAHLTHLSVSVKLTAVHWEYILPTITLHTLKHVAFLNIPLQFLHLLSFLSRQTSLQTLEVSNETKSKFPTGEIRFPEDYCHPYFLPSLERLIATPEYIIPFSAHAELGFLPCLKTFDLRNCFYERNTVFTSAQGKREDINKAYRPIFEHFAMLSSGKMDAESGSGMAELNEDVTKQKHRRENIYEFFPSISEFSMRSSGEMDARSSTGLTEKIEDVPQRKLHLKLYAISLTALVELITLSDDEGGFRKIGPMNNIHTVTLVYTNGWTPPPFAMHHLRHWMPRQEKLAKAFERAKDLFAAPTGGTINERLNTVIQSPKDIWLLSLFLCHAFPGLERIISEHRGRTHEIEVDRSLFDC